MNAGRLLRIAGYDSAVLRQRIAPIDPDLVNIWPAGRLFRRFWRPGIKGVTHGRFVFVDPALMSGDPERLARLVIHELIHVRQFAVTGYLGFVSRYLRQYWTGRLGGKSARDAYLDIDFEREARDVTSRVVLM